MAKRKPKQDLAKVKPAAGVPDYLADHMEDDASLDDMVQYRVVPRLKLIQSTSSGELKEHFSEGTVLLMPGKMPVCDSDGGFEFQPLLFFTEFCKWSDLDDGDSDTIVDRTFDPASALAKASRDPDARSEPYGETNKNYPNGKYTYRYVEHLNFVGLLRSGEFAMELVSLDFSRGEFSTGKSVISSSVMRKIPLWSQIWAFTPSFRDKGPKRKWWGLDYSPPEGDTVIEEEDVAKSIQSHNDLKELQEKKRLIVDHSGSDDAEEKDDGDGEY